MATLSAARRVIVKIGSSLIAEPGGAGVRSAWMAALAADLATLRGRGADVVIVSSGAVALGRGALKLGAKKLTLEEKQAAAAAGQPLLMRAWAEAFGADITVAQALLTPDDTEQRRRWLNARETLSQLLALKAVPIINENDTVATQELRYGDNDRLAARVAQMAGADLLVLLSDIDGLYTKDPRHNPDAEHLPTVDVITPAIEAMAGGVNMVAGVGSGGMRTKIDAAKIATAAGASVVIANGQGLHPLQALVAGARATWFAPAAEPKAAYKAWIAGALSPAGAILVDAGAAAALAQGKSLLPAGVTGVKGGFGKGDTVRVLGPDGREVARGVARYDAADAMKIQGLRSAAIAEALGWEAGPTLIHADDLVLST